MTNKAAARLGSRFIFEKLFIKLDPISFLSLQTFSGYCCLVFSVRFKRYTV